MPLITKQLSFDAAKEIFQGQDRSFEMRAVEIKTKNLLDKDSLPIQRKISILPQHPPKSRTRGDSSGYYNHEEEK